MASPSIINVLRRASFAPDDKEEHDRIQEVLETEATLKRYEEPPLELLIYAANNILGLKDNNIFSQMPDLLNLLAQIELCRHRINNEIRRALASNTFYSRDEDSDTELLTPEEIARLKRFLYSPEKEEKMRVSYEVILQYCIRRHILHLWSNNESYLLSKWMRIYFQDKYPSHDPPQMFHKVLSEQTFAEAADECMRFLVGAKLWYEQYKDIDERKYKNIDEKNSLVAAAKEEYGELVINLIESDDEGIIRGVKHYMGRATRALDAMDYLNEVFPLPYDH